MRETTMEGMQMIIDKAEDCSMKGKFVKDGRRKTSKELKDYLQIDWVKI